MSTLCSCDVSLQNTGSPNCSPILGVGVNAILVPLIANDGTYNKIDPSAVLNSAYFTDLLNEADDSKRWYPTGKMKNITTDRADPIRESFDDGSSVFIRDGIRTYTGMLIKGSFELSGQFNANRCSTFGAYIIDVDGSILGTTNGDGYLYPIEVDAATFYSKMMFTTDTTIQKIMLSWQWGVTQKDDNLRMISANSITGINLADSKGLMNVYATINSTTTTEMVVDLYAKFGNIVTNTPIEGLVTADFVSSDSGSTSKIYNVTDASDVTITAAESTTIAGQYTLTYTAQVVGDVLQPMIKKNGLDGFTLVGSTGTAV